MILDGFEQIVYPVDLALSLSAPLNQFIDPVLRLFIQSTFVAICFANLIFNRQPDELG